MRLILFFINLCHILAYPTNYRSGLIKSKFHIFTRLRIQGLGTEYYGNRISLDIKSVDFLSSLSINSGIKVNVVQAPKLPVWPVWSGIVVQILEWVGQKNLANAILMKFGGRVIPLQLADLDISPFLLLVHHEHSFTPLDPFRALTRLILPEGFSAHPHAGFDTVTYCIEGGLRHRDSEGIKMYYGDGQLQWMRAGRGIIHEEMWNIKPWKHQRIELFQLWLNLPRARRNDFPFSKIASKGDIPEIVLPFEGNGESKINVKVISGRLDVGLESESLAASPVGIYHLSALESHVGESILSIKISGTKTALLYIRRGSVRVASDSTFVAKKGDLLLFRRQAINNDDFEVINEDISFNLILLEGFDGLLLAGAELSQPVLMQGSFVDSDSGSLAKSAAVFNSLGPEGFWKPDIDDNEWLQHCQKIQLNQVIKMIKSL